MDFGGFGFDEEFMNVLKHLNISSAFDMGRLVDLLVTNAEIDALKKLRKAINTYIKVLQSRTETSEFEDPYSILGVSSTSTREEVKSAFRKKAWESHPDRGGSNDDMIKVNAAYEAIRRVRGWH